MLTPKWLSALIAEGTASSSKDSPMELILHAINHYALQKDGIRSNVSKFALFVEEKEGNKRIITTREGFE